MGPNVVNNIDFARFDLKSFIYELAILEGIDVSISQAEASIYDEKICDESITGRSQSVA